MIPLARRRSRPITRGIGRSELVPYIPGEDWRDRHQRRLAAALENVRVLSRLLEPFGASITLFDYGGHWQIRLGLHILEWWPLSGRLVRDKPGSPRRVLWGAAVKAHDIYQVERFVSAWIRNHKLVVAPRPPREVDPCNSPPP